MATDLLSLEDVLKEAEGMGLELSERTSRYYSVMGLLPRPVKRPPGAYDARVHYYERDILERLQQIRGLQAQGYSLKQLKKQFDAAPVSGTQDASAPPALIRAVSDGTLRQAWKKFLDAPPLEGALRQAGMDFLADLLSIQGESAELLAALPSGELESSLRRLSQWHEEERFRRRAVGTGTLKALSSEQMDDLKARVQAVDARAFPTAARAQARLLELLGQIDPEAPGGFEALHQFLSGYRALLES